MNGQEQPQGKQQRGSWKIYTLTFKVVGYQAILFTLIFFISTIQVTQACDGCISYNYHTLSDNSVQKSCDGSCNGTCQKYSFLKVQKISGNQSFYLRQIQNYLGSNFNIKQCYGCSCSSALTYYPFNSQSGAKLGYWACDSTCTTPNCFRKIYTTVDSDSLYFCVWCPGNCSACVNDTYCTTCNNGHYFLASVNLCPRCDQLWGPGCATCDITKCFTCAGKWAFDLNYTKSTYGCCTHCPDIPNCETCIDGPICTACVAGGVFNTTTVLPEKQCILCSVFIPNCATCIDGPICTACAAGSVFNTTTILTQKHCIICTDYIAQCATCVDGPICLTCVADAHFNLTSTLPQKQCIPCTIYPNCSTCADGIVCVTCITDHFFNLTSPDTQKPCVPCSYDNCAICTQGPKCQTCDPLFYFNYSSTDYSTPCVPCLFQNCSTCIHGPICITCIALHYFDLSVSHPNYVCVPCTFPDCALCADGPKCINCDIRFFLNASTLPKPVCQPCSDIENCVNCLTNQPICTICTPGHFLNYSTSTHECVPCTIAQCLVCDHGPICLLCTANFIPNPATSFRTCVACPPNYYSLNNLCYPCAGDITKCLACYHTGSELNCTHCESTAVIDPKTLSCFNCIKITSYCRGCDDISTCTQCKYPYLLGSTGKCDVCEPGFEKLDNLCIKPQGCQNSVPDYSRCLSCFPQYNFMYDERTNSCICMTGFVLKKVNGSAICLSICGNGIPSIPEEQCDDGNVRSGDGCDQNCQVEPDYVCTINSPSQCTLYLNVTKLQYNYAYRIQGKNRGRFSFSLLPFHSAYQYVDWAQYLSLNISMDFLIPQSVTYVYFLGTNEITLEFDYRQTLQTLVTRATLSFSKNTARLLQTEEQNYLRVSSKIIPLAPQIFSMPDSLSLDITLSGINAMLTLDDEGMLAAYQAASVGFTVITVIILLLFLLGSYSHKMIGLQTIQIIQFNYFMTMIVEQKASSFLKAMNVLKFSAFGGYSDFELFYGDISQQVQSITSSSIHKSFTFAGLLKYFFINVNISLAVPVLGLSILTVCMVKKFMKRAQYLQKKQEHLKDEYTVVRRSAQWVYDHCVFPLINLFGMISFFCTIIELSSKQSTSSQINENTVAYLQMTSFTPHTFILFSTFFIFAFEIFVSYDQLKYSRLTQSEKARVPSSTLQKLQHDSNNPDRQNYKPGYVMLYLFYYLLVQIILTLNVLIEPIAQYGVEMMLVLSGSYLVFVWKWSPYMPSIDFHNKALRLNHVAAFIFVIICEIMNRIDLSPMIGVVLIYLSLTLITIVVIVCCVRIYIELKFRKRLEDEPDLLESDLKKDPFDKLDPLKKKQHMMMNNKYSFEHQINMPYRPQKLPNSSSINPIEDEEYERMKKNVRKQIYSKKNFRINVENDLFMEEYAIDEPKSKKSLSEKLICEERETTEQQKNNKSKE